MRLLVVFPRRFRDKYADSMAQGFRDGCRMLQTRREIAAYLWLCFTDLAGSAVREHMATPAEPGAARRRLLVVLLIGAATGWAFRGQIETFAVERAEVSRAQAAKDDESARIAYRVRVADKLATHDEARAQIVAAALYSQARFDFDLSSIHPAPGEASIDELRERLHRSYHRALALGWSDPVVLLHAAELCGAAPGCRGPEVRERLSQIDGDNAAVGMSEFSRATGNHDAQRQRQALSQMQAASRYDCYEREYVRVAVDAFNSGPGSVVQDELTWSLWNFRPHTNLAPFDSWCRAHAYVEPLARSACFGVARKMATTTFTTIAGIGASLASDLAEQSGDRNAFAAQAKGVWWQMTQLATLNDTSPACNSSATDPAEFFRIQWRREGTLLAATRDVLNCDGIPTSPPAGWSPSNVIEISSTETGGEHVRD